MRDSLELVSRRNGGLVQKAMSYSLRLLTLAWCFPFSLIKRPDWRGRSGARGPGAWGEREHGKAITEPQAKVKGGLDPISLIPLSAQQ